MQSWIVVHPQFDGVWPWAADHLHRLWQAQGPVQFVRLAPDDKRPLGDVLADSGNIRRLVSFNVPAAAACGERLTGLKEAAIFGADDLAEALRKRGVTIRALTSEGFWDQSVAEFALGLTLAALRRIPQTHRQMITDLAAWDYSPPREPGVAGARGQQFGDDPRFTNGTIAGKRVRLVGIGNIGSRYASFCHALGADVAAWDPVAQEPCFHRSGARRVASIERLVADAEIFAPMMPLRPATTGIVTAGHIAALPKKCLVVLVTRTQIVDTPTLRRRVLADELALAADVFDVEPVPLSDPLLGRHNVVHTPHNAGRTVHANHEFAEQLASQFEPVSGR